MHVQPYETVASLFLLLNAGIVKEGISWLTASSDVSLKGSDVKSGMEWKFPELSKVETSAELN